MKTTVEFYDEVCRVVDMSKIKHLDRVRRAVQAVAELYMNLPADTPDWLVEAVSDVDMAINQIHSSLEDDPSPETVSWLQAHCDQFLFPQLPVPSTPHDRTECVRIPRWASAEVSGRAGTRRD